MSNFTPPLTVTVNHESSATAKGNFYHFLKQLRWIAILFVMALPLKLWAQAPSISYTGPQTYTAGTAITALMSVNSGGVVAAPGYGSSLIPLGSGFNGPGGVAVDAAGNVYVADYGNGRVDKIPAGGGPTVAVGSGFHSPSGVATDAAGNVYVADSNDNDSNNPNGPNGAVYKIAAVGGTTVRIGSFGLTNPGGITTDAAGNVYVTDLNNNGVYKISAIGGGTAAIASISNPVGITVDATGNVYVATGSGATIMMISAGSGGIPVAYGSGFNKPSGVTVDAAGNVYVADSGNGLIKEIPVGGGTPVTIASGFNNPYGITIDAAGDLYVSGNGNNTVREIQPTGGYYISPFLPAGLTFNNSTGIISGTPTVASAATNYMVTAYNAGGGGTATLGITVTLPSLPVISYSGPQTYTKGTAITALSPASSNVSAQGYSSNMVPLGAVLVGPLGIAVDATGNVYVADATNNDNQNNGTVKEISANGGATVIIGTGFAQPKGVAADLAGNVYVADALNSAVYKIPAGGATVAFNSGFSNPWGISTDPAGNVYVANNGNGAIMKIPPGGGPVTLGTVSGAIAVAADAAGNVYVATGSGSTIKEIPVNGDGTPVAYGSGFSNPSGLAVDAAGNVYVSDTGHGMIKEIPSGGGTPVTIASGLSNPYGIAIDAAGNLYVSGYANQTVREIKPAGGYYISPFLPAGLSFNSATGTISGTPTVVTTPTNYTAIAYNSFGSGTASVNVTVTTVVVPIPSISYTGPQTYTAGTAITALMSVNSGGVVAAPGYGSSLIPLGSGFNGPGGVAVDAAGNVYVADYGNGRVDKIPAGGGPTVAVGSGFHSPSGVATDAAGNVYVADSNDNDSNNPNGPNGAVYKIAAVGGTTVRIGSFGLTNPGGITTDAAGNVYVTDLNNNGVYKISAIGGGTAAIASISNPVGITVDATGNVYVATGSGATIMMISAGSGGIPVAYGSGFNKPSGVTVDAAGNVYVADSGNGLIKEIPVGGGTPVTIASGFNNPYGITIDAAGDLYVSGNGNNTVREIQPTGGYYISPFLPAGLTFNNSTGIISGTPTVASAATNYMVTAYNAGGGGTATLGITVTLPSLPVISYSGPQTYTKGTAITALSPASSNVSAQGYSSNMVPLGAVLVGPLGIAVDATGNVYVADATNNDNQNNGTVKEISANGGATVIIGTGFAQPKGVAADLAGNVYVADALNSAVYKIPAGGATVAFNSGFSNPWGISTDPAGNVYVANNGNGAIMKIPPGGGPVTLGTVSGAIAVAADAAGNVYVATGSGSTIKEIPVNGDGTPVAYGSGFSNPSGLAVDAAGNVYVSDTGHGMIKEIPSGGGTPVTIASGLSNPYGIAIDAAGNLYVSGYANQTVREIKPAGGYYISPFLPAGLSFNSATGTISGTPTVVTTPTNYTAIAYNSFGLKAATVNIVVGVLGFTAIPSKPYGTADFSPGAFSTHPITYTSSNTAVATIISGNIHIIGAGTSTITATDGYTTLTQALTVTAVPLTITVNNQTRIYGVANPALTVAYTGFVYNDNADSLTTQPIVTTVATASSPVGPYAITASGAVDGNYIISYVAGTFTITPAPLTITANSVDKTYGTLLTGGAGSTAFTPTGLQNSETIGSVTIAYGTGAAANAAAGTYTGSITLSAPTGGSFTASNYTITFVAGNVIVGKAPLTITANNVNKTYGTPLTGGAGSTTFTHTALQNSETVGSVTITYGTGGPANASAGTYTASVSPSSATGSFIASNYNITYVAGNIIVGKAPLTITANNVLKPYGTTLTGGAGSGSFATTGAQNSETVGSVTITYGAGSAANAAVGTYTGSVSPSSATGGTFIASNYTITYVPGNIIVGTVPLTITANNVNKTYGTLLTGTAGSTAFTPTGLQNSETVGGVTIAYGTGAAANAAAGTYTGSITTSTATGGTFTASNYTITFIAGNIIVGKAPLTITANNVNKTYGTALTGATGSMAFTFTGLQNSETIGSVTIAYSSGSSAKAAAATYTASVTPSAATGGTFTASNYTITYSKGNIIVGRAPLTITANKVVKNYGTLLTGAAGSTAFTPTGLQNSETIGSVTIAYGTGAAANAAAGTYPGSVIPSAATGGTFGAANYTISYVAGTLTVLSTNANLSNLAISSGTLSPAFASGATGYTASVPYPAASITVTPTTSDATATVTVNGTTVTSGSASGAIALSVGANTITTIVTAQDGVTTDTYTITVTRAAPSTNADLASLTISKGALAPVFASESTSYTDMVTNGTASVTLTPTIADATATITVNGATVSSGTASGAIALAVGSNSVSVVVTAQDNSTKTYTVNVIRPSTNARLSALTLSSGTLTPVFNTNTTSYTTSVTNMTSSITLTPTVAVTGATVAINGTAVTSGNASGAIALSVGTNTITIIVTAQDGVTTDTYTVTVTRVPSSNANLSNLTVSKGTLTPAFAGATTSYTNIVTNGTTSVTVTPTVADATATVTINGTVVASGHASGVIPLTVGSNVITTIVTAQDDAAQKTYSVNIIRPSTDAKLTLLKISSGTLTPAFNTNTVSYTDAVTNATTSVTITPTVAVTAATVKVNGITVASGTTSGPIALAVGGNTITTVVTAQDGVTTDTYTLTVTRASASTNDNLSALVISKGVLTPSFATATTNYTDMVTNGTTSLTITPTTQVTTSAATINGVTVLSGHASGAITLAVGSNTITIVITAQDGTTKKTYAINVIRPSTNAKLTLLKISSGALTPAFNTNTINYTASVTNAITSIKVTPTVAAAGATIKVNGTAVTSGSPSSAIALNVGSNTVTTKVTAQDGVTTDTYTITVTRAASGANTPDAEVSVQTRIGKPLFDDDVLVVHQGISPNGDGVNDYLQIDGISNYPDNNLKIMNRSGLLVYEAKGYDNNAKLFDGHSNKNGQMQLPGTYFYSLDYTVKGVVKHKTGFIVLKY